MSIKHNHINKLVIIVPLLLLLACTNRSTNNQELSGKDEKKQETELRDVKIISDLSDSNSDDLIEIDIGNLHLPTGKIIAGDPFFTEKARPFFRSVKPGTYPVRIYMTEVEADHYRIAYAKIKFKNEYANNWILALRDDIKMENIADLKEDEYIGFPVDGGLGCFLDVKTNALYVYEFDSIYEQYSDYKMYNDLLTEEFLNYSSNNRYSGEQGDWNNHIVDIKSGLNVIMFTSGWGDGIYPAYWGYNDKKETVELTIDFLVRPVDNLLLKKDLNEADPKSGN